LGASDVKPFNGTVEIVAQLQNMTKRMAAKRGFDSINLS
jgi:hypothetical protein